MTPALAAANRRRLHPGDSHMKKKLDAPFFLIFLATVNDLIGSFDLIS